MVARRQTTVRCLCECCQDRTGCDIVFDRYGLITQDITISWGETTDRRRVALDRDRLGFALDGDDDFVVLTAII